MFAIETSRVGRAVGRTQVIDRVVTLVRLLDTVKPEDVPGMIAAFGSPRHHFSVDAGSIVPEHAMGADEARLARRLDGRLHAGAGPARLLLIERDPDDEQPEGARRFKPDALQVSVRLADGRWLNGEAPLKLPLLPWMRLALSQIAASVIAVLAVIGLALRGVLGPVAALATAAEQLGRGTAVAPLPENGPRELRRMSAAFNEMQARLRAFVDDRTRMLAAISHDLRTPIASLWLRAEMVEDAELRGAMVSTLADLRAWWMPR
jgi:signal transduction histidine kinase